MNDAHRESIETRVLVLAPTVKDAELTLAILDRADIACVCCLDLPQLCVQLTAGAAAVLIAEEVVNGDDGCLAEWLHQQPSWSDLPVLVLARSGADSVAVARAIDRLGNVSVLERPVRVAALVSAIRTALRARQRQYQLRNELLERERIAEERDRAMASLTATSEQLRLALSSAKTFAFSWDIPTNEVHRIDSMVTALKSTNGIPDTFEGVLSKIHPDDRSHFEGRVRDVLNSPGLDYYNNYRVVEPTGTARWITDVGRVEFGPDGEPVRLAALATDVTERKEAEAALQASQERFRLAADAINGIIYEYDFATGHVERTRGLFEVLGHRPDEVPPTAEWWSEQMHPDDRERLNNFDLQAVGSVPSLTEYRVRHKDGQWLHVEDRGLLVKDKEGRAVRMIGCTMNVTARKEAQAQLRYSEQLHRAAFDHSPLGLVYVGEDGRFNKVNPAMCEITGYLAEELLEMKVFDLTHPDDLVRDNELLAPYLRGETSYYQNDKRYLRKDGNVRWVTVSARMVTDAAGRRLHSVGVVRDITEQKQSEEQVRQSEHRLRLATEAAVIGLWEWDVHTNVVNWSAECYTIHGLLEGEFDGTADGFDRILHPEDRSRVWATVRAAVADQTRYECEFRIIRPNGEVRWVSNVGRALYDHGQPIKMVGTITDVTDRKVVEERMRLAVEVAGLGVIHIDYTDDTCTPDSTSAALFGLEHGVSVPRSHVHDRFHPDDKTEILQRIQQCLDPLGNGRISLELRIIRPDGTKKWLSVQQQIVFGENGGVRRPVAGILAAVDISARKQAEEAVRVSEERLGGILRRSPAGIIQTDAAGCMTLVNPRWCEMLGYSDTELLGRNILEITHPTFVDETATAFSRLAAGGPDFQIEKAYCRKDGSVFRAQSNVAAIRSQDGMFRGLIAVVLDISERLRTEDELRNSEQRMRLATEATSVGIWEWNVATGQILWDAQMFRIYGVPQTQDGYLYYDTWRDAVLPEDLARQEEVLQETVHRAGNSRREFRIRRPCDGAIRVIQSVETVRKDAEGQVKSVVGTNLDITERKQVETALRESEERSAFVRRSSGVGFWYCDLPFDVLEWDDLVKAHFYLPRDAIVTMQTFYDRIHPEDREQTRLAVERSIAERAHYNVDYRTVNPETGATRWVRAIGRTFYSPDGTPTRFDGITLDVTEQKRAEATLTESEQRFREMANVAPAMIWVTDEKHECTFLSQSWLEFTGQRMDDGLGLGWLDAVHPEDRDIAKASFFHAATHREPFKFDCRLRTKDGHYRWAIDAGKPRFDEEDKFIGYVGAVIDDHDRHEFQLALDEARAKAESSNESKSAFLANMSHEIRTPMTAILGYVDLLKDLINHDDGRRYLQTIRNNGYFLLDIINDILDLSKIEAGKLEIECERFEPQRLIDDVKGIMEIRAKEGGLMFEVHYEGRLPRIIHSDAKRLKQILINLVGNAIKFTHQGKVQIRVQFDATKHRLHFDIVDTGIGIPPEQMTKLFQPFSQGDASVSRNFGGTGLGLIISQRLAEMLGGSITVTSVEGVGSTFSVSIATGEYAGVDLIDDHILSNESNIEPLANLNAPIKLKCHVLVVDDRRDIRFLSKHFLTESGATVAECHDGLVAVEHISACIEQGTVPDLILLDMQMPNLDGYATAQRLRSLGYTRPIVALTADAMHGDMVRCLEVGCNGYLSKPIDKTLLLKKVAELTGNDIRDRMA